MKSSFFQFLLFAGYFAVVSTDLDVSLSYQSDESTIVQALSEVLIYAYAKKSSAVNFIVCGNGNLVNHHIFISKVLKTTEVYVKYQVETCENLSDVYRRRFVILFIDSNRARDLFLMTPIRFDFSGYYLVHFLNHDIDHTHIERLFKSFLDMFIYNANVLTADSDSINLTTFYPFTEASCRSTKPVVVNEHINGAWNSTVFYPHKMRNLQKCPLKVAAFLYSAAGKTLDL